MSLLDERKFTFTWQILNFSMCPSMFKESIFSKVFTVERIENSEWQIELYPRGNKTENALTCYLYCRSVADNTEGFKVDSSFTTVSAVSKSKEYIMGNHAFKKDQGFGFCSFISRNDIFGDKETYLPNDTLTIKCSIWRSDDSEIEKKSVQLSNAMLSLSSTLDNTYESGQLDECSVVTCVEVQKRNVFWSIRNFSSIGFNRTLITRVPSALKDQPSFFITFYKSIANQSAEIKIRCPKTFSSKKIFVKCKISVLYTPKGIDIFAEDEHLFDFTDDYIWKFPSFMKLNRLKEDANLGKMYDILHLRFEFSFSMIGKVHHLEKVFSHQYGTLMNLPHPIEEFKLLYRDKELSDVTIRVDDREFKVLKTILKARSPVFRAMLENDMKEKKTGVIVITDVDPDIVDKMLAFMYTNVIEDIEVADALKLYFIADKYEIQPLKIECICVLASSLSVSNVCGVLTLANQHNDEYLHECAENFVRMNSVEVLKSSEWEDLMKNNASLASKVMFKMLTI